MGIDAGTGLSAGVVALLTHWNVNLEKRVIQSPVRKSGRIHESPLAGALIEQLDGSADPSTPLFPALQAETEPQLND